MDSLNQEIDSITQKLIRDYKPQKIILFGSGAKGKTGPTSDIDMLIIKKTRKRFVDRIGEVLNLVDSTRLEPLVYTPQELQSRLAIQDFFINEVLKTGKTLYAK
ncbi:hypothetical protein CO015_05340 [candidate division WWE3 bacterium CG_4_8_14_3_um_filter_42_11]|uniref:Polymerase beta nucleotidyltransferase domain-containing protein n=1 Tax=candidate division WWE3 bacterium CG_4_8_14_3_um_filter_42_11 TaxID=1975076 RepID=A0A2M8G5Q4_UNCKA|nr:MAG: hypothetical protein CO015_05340 [candidate division WWE3 bacterium CG_4_8_14_3_um_filter_42_11]